MKKLSYTNLISLLFVLISCQNKQTEITVLPNETAVVNSNSGKILMDFGGLNGELNQIQIYNLNEELELDLNFKNLGGFYGSIRTNDKDLYKDFNSYILGVNENRINDSSHLSISNSLITKLELRASGNLLYFAIYEDGNKTYNSLNMRLETYEFIDNSKVLLTLKNYFPFNGDLVFKYYNTDRVLNTKKIDNNLYMIEYESLKESDNKIKIDVTINPSKEDTVINSTFVQEITIKG